ncbi:N-acetyltransferase [Streptomyces misionensis]|uniref:N-acetyltransferase n=1 Tax=Streptomyces misionensis TaxID=67331 RepID=A0A5C6K044_9ACTN|nr:GNAT family N-acetyltransferase [Streptomyces misionensis]TWV55829.1 N-acetyltransferase [Streptomyces misionensis]
MLPIYERNRAVTVRRAHAGDAEAVRAIRNHAIEHSTALWTETPQSAAEGAAWLAAHLERGSAFVAETDGEVAGFAVFAPWRALDGYRHTVEDSVYVRAGRHGLGIGSALLAALIAAAREAGHHLVIAGIEAGNGASIRLHERFGFEHAGTVREAGIKFGRRLDLTLMRLPLD